MNNRIMIFTESLEHSQVIQDFINDSRDCTVAVIDTTSGFMKCKDICYQEDKKLNEILIGNSRFERFEGNTKPHDIYDIIDRSIENTFLFYMMNYLSSIKIIIENKNTLSDYNDYIVKFLLKITNIEKYTFDKYYTTDIIKYEDMTHAICSIGNVSDKNFEHSKYITINEKDDICRLQDKDAILVGNYIFVRMSSIIKKELLYLLKMIDISQILEYVKEKINISDILNELQKIIRIILTPLFKSNKESIGPNLVLYFNRNILKFAIPQYAKCLNDRYHSGCEVFHDGLLSCTMDLSLVGQYDIDNIFKFEINKKKYYDKEDGYIVDFPQLECKLFSTVENNKNQLMLMEYLSKLENYCITLHGIINKEIIPTIKPDIYKVSIIDENGNTYINKNYMKGKLIYDIDKEKVGIIDEVIIVRLEGQINELFLKVKNIIPIDTDGGDEELWMLNNREGRIYRNYNILNDDLTEAYDFIYNYILNLIIDLKR